MEYDRVNGQLLPWSKYQEAMTESFEERITELMVDIQHARSRMYDDEEYINDLEVKLEELKNESKKHTSRSTISSATPEPDCTDH